MDSPHTPGPWRAVIESDQPQILYKGIICTVESGSGYKAVVTDGPQETCLANEWEANARLIARAPEMDAKIKELEATNADLLAALQALVESFNEPEDGSGDDNLESYFRGPVKQARAAIERATKGGNE